MSDQPHYPYRDGDRAVLGPDVTATPDGMTITWQGANYRRDHGEHVGAATPLICSDERHAAKVAALQADLDRYEEVLGDLNETLVDRAQQAARAEAAVAGVRAAVTILEDDMAAAVHAGHEQGAYALKGAVLRITAALDQHQEH